MDVSPNDLDIITSIEGLKVFKKRFQKYCVSDIQKRPSSKEGSPEYYEIKLKINNVEVDVNGEYDSDLYMSRIKDNSIVFTKVDGYNVPCFGLRSEADAYAELGRPEKGKLIKDFLTSKDKYD